MQSIRWGVTMESRALGKGDVIITYVIWAVMGFCLGMAAGISLVLRFGR